MLSLALALWLGAPAVAQQGPPAPPETQEVRIGPSNCGLFTRYASHLIPDGCYQEAVNVIFDSDLGVQRRRGYAAFNGVALSTPMAIRRAYNFDAPDGQHYVIAVSSDKLWKAGTDGIFTALTGVISGSENTSCTQALGKLWCVNRVNGLFYWDGTAVSTTAVSAGPLGSLAANFRNRVLVADVANNQTRLYASGYLDGTDWTTGSQSTAPFIQPLGGVNDGDKITCLMGTYGDFFVIGTQTRLYGLYGFDNNDFQVREISREVGCLENTSVQEYDGSLVWLSRRGLERMRGTSLDWRVSEPVYDILKTIVGSAGNTVTLTDISRTDFEAGNLEPSGPGAKMSATISAGNVVPTTWTVSQTTASDWDVFTSSLAVSTYVIAGQLQMTFSSFSFYNGDLVLGTTENWTAGGSGGGWSVVDPGDANGTDSCASLGTSDARFAMPACNGDLSRTSTIAILDASNNSLASCSVTWSCNIAANVCTVASSTCGGDVGAGSYHVTARLRTPNSEFSRSTMKLKITDGASGATLTSIASHTATGVSVKILSDGNGNCGTSNVFGLKYSACSVQNYGKDVSATYTSKAFDTGLSTPVWGISALTLSSTTETGVTFKTQTSADGSTNWSTLATQTNNEKITSTARRHLRYEYTFTTSIPTKTPVAYDNSFTAATTGYFISQCRTPGTAITSWGLFSCGLNIPTGASMTLYVATGADCGHAISQASTNTWNTQTNNTVISIATAPAVAYRALFDFDAASEAVSGTGLALQDCSFSWQEGAARPETASAVIDHKYHLFYTTSTASGATNTDALILDYYDRWAQWNNIPARTAVTFKSQQALIIGDGAANGKLYRLYSGYDDAGAAFTSRFRTKDFDLGDWGRQKEFVGVKLELSPLRDPTDTVTMTVKGHVDKVSALTLNTVSLAEDTGLVYGNTPTPLDNQVSGRYIGFEVTNTGTQHWRFYRGALQYRPLRED